METVTLIEVGPRDGFQRQAAPIPTEKKVEVITRLVDAGLRYMQVTSFAHSRVVPQMADAEVVCARLPRHRDVVYNALVFNRRGLDRAHKAGIRHVEIAVPASETLCQQNVRYSVNEGMVMAAAVIERAHALNISVRADIQTAFGCAYEGHIEQARVLNMVEQFLGMGVEEVLLSDSAGLGNPRQVSATVQAALALTGTVPLSLHLHDTRGLGLANLYAALEAGVTRFDTAFGGLGGCPFIPAAVGNIATEDAANMLHEMGVKTGVSVAQVSAISRDMEDFLDTKLPGKIHSLVG